MPQASIVSRVTSSARWAFLESALGATASFVTVLVLARYLSPGEFGRAGIAVALSMIVQSAVLGGMPDALVRSPSAHTQLSDALFWALFGVGAASAAAIAAIGLATAVWLGDRPLGALIAVQGLTTLAVAAAAVPTGLLLRKMRTQALVKRTAVAKLSGLVASCGFALGGHGAWAIVYGNLFAQGFGAIQLLGTMRRPALRWRDPLLGAALRAGMMSGALQSLGTLSSRGFVLAFGAAFGAYQVGLFNFALRLVEESCGVVISTLRRVTVASFAAAKRQGLDMAPLFVSGTNVIAYVTAPLFLGGAAVAPDAIALLFGATWAGAVPALQLMLAMWVVRANRMLVTAILVVEGRQRAMVGFGAVGLAATAIALALAAPFGPGWAKFAYAGTLVAVVFGGPTFARHTGIGVAAQIGAGLFPIALAIAMATVVVGLRIGPLVNVPLPWRLAVEVLSGGMFFAGLAVIFDRAGLARLLRLVRR